VTQSEQITLTDCVSLCLCVTLNYTFCSHPLDGKLQWEEEAHVDRDNSNEVILPPQKNATNSEEVSASTWTLAHRIHTEDFCITSLYINSIQFILYKAHFRNLQICLRGLYNASTYDIPDLWPHIGSGKTPRKMGENPFTGKIKGRNLQGSNRGGSLSPDGQVQ